MHNSRAWNTEIQHGLIQCSGMEWYAVCREMQCIAIQYNTFIILSIYQLATGSLGIVHYRDIMHTHIIIITVQCGVVQLCQQLYDSSCCVNPTICMSADCGQAQILLKGRLFTYHLTMIKHHHERRTLTGTTVLISSSKTPINAITPSLASYRSTLAIYEEKNSVLNKCQSREQHMQSRFVIDVQLSSTRCVNGTGDISNFRRRLTKNLRIAPLTMLCERKKRCELSHTNVLNLLYCTPQPFPLLCTWPVKLKISNLRSRSETQQTSKKTRSQLKSNKKLKLMQQTRPSQQPQRSTIHLALSVD